MIYINWVYKGAVICSDGFPVVDTEGNRSQLDKDIAEKKVFIPENHERYILSGHNMIDEWVG